MGFKKDAYATCWSVKEGKGNSLRVRLSVSRKNKEGEYEQDFSGFCTFIGTAKVKAERLKPKDRIKLGDVDVSTWYNKEKGVEYVTYKVFDFEMADAHDTPSSSSNKLDSVDNPEEGDNDEDDCPF